MKNISIVFVSLILIFTSCSTGKKAFQKGDYFYAVSKAVERLKSSPDNKKAIQVLRESYPMSLEWSQEEIDLSLSGNNLFKWERTVHLMKQVNSLSEQIRSTPAARKIITDPKNYSSELNIALEKAAEARYEAGLIELEQNTKETARIAFDHFFSTNIYLPGYKNVAAKLDEAKELATSTVILETIPVNTAKYKLSSEFLYNKIFEYVNRTYPSSSFVRFYSPEQAEKFNLQQPDFIVQMEFFDFSIGNVVRSEKEEELEKKVKIESKDTTRVRYNVYKAKLKTYTDQIISGGTLRFNIVEFKSNRLLSDELIPGSFTWINDYGIYVGDVEALNNVQKEIVNRKALPLPPEQDLFIEITKPIYDQVTGKLRQFFRHYK